MSKELGNINECLHCRNFKTVEQEGMTPQDLLNEIQTMGKICGMCTLKGACYPMFHYETCENHTNLKTKTT